VVSESDNGIFINQFVEVVKEQLAKEGESPVQHIKFINEVERVPQACLKIGGPPSTLYTAYLIDSAPVP